MIPSLYEPFKHWAAHGSVYILSDLHFNDSDCKLMDKNWISPEEQIAIINKNVFASDTFVCLGDVGKPEYVSKIKAKQKILLLGNHDKKHLYTDLFTEVYDGPLFIAEKILLSHEPVFGLSDWCLNIHGHDHSGSAGIANGHLNLAANVCNYTPVNLGKLIKDGALSNIKSIHRVTIDGQILRKQKRSEKNGQIQKPN